MNRLNVVTPPASEPVTLAEAKLFSRIDIPDDDALITSLITAARTYCETYTHQTFCTTTFAYLLDYLPYGGGYYNRLIRENVPSFNWLPTYNGVIYLPTSPVASVVSFTYLDTAGTLQTLASDQYLVLTGQPGSVTPAYGKTWPIVLPVMGAVSITYTAGYSADGTSVPECVKTAIKYLVNHWYNHRESVTDGSFSEVPVTVNALLDSINNGMY